MKDFDYFSFMVDLTNGYKENFVEDLSEDFEESTIFQGFTVISLVSGFLAKHYNEVPKEQKLKLLNILKAAVSDLIFVLKEADNA
ncbi:MAG: hypothetical protein J7K15_12170 [Deltaproteobacteria bacterium]|nr:hypothetical protein [Deltaproteobacteria bacterium]